MREKREGWTRTGQGLPEPRKPYWVRGIVYPGQSVTVLAECEIVDGEAQWAPLLDAESLPFTDVVDFKPVRDFGVHPICRSRRESSASGRTALRRSLGHGS